MKHIPSFFARLMTVGLIAACLCSAAPAQESGRGGKSYTYAPGSPTHWRETHDASNGTYQRDPNIWVYSTELAQRVGLPLEWASDELKGASAVAFRMEPDGAEEDCGWGKQTNICKKVVQCVMEFYFDRQKQPLPWTPNRPVVDVDWQSISSAKHLLASAGWQTELNGDRARKDLSTRSPFADPDTGAELFWSSPGSMGKLRVLAYDREIHGRYAFVRIDVGCGQGAAVEKEWVLHLQLKDPKTQAPIKVLHELRIPGKWNLRVVAHTKQQSDDETQFFKQTWQQINQGAPK